MVHVLSKQANILAC